MNYYEDKQRRTDVFEDTERVCRTNERLIAAIRETQACTKLFTNEDCKDGAAAFEKKETPCEVVFSQDRAFEAAHKHYRKNQSAHIGVLCFTAAMNPGGGVTTGSSAQEEALCRASTLYDCMNTQALTERYFDRNKADERSFYVDDCIHLPGIYVIKEDAKFPVLMPEAEWYKVDIITSAAPNLKKIKQTQGVRMPDKRRLYKIFRTRISNIFYAAASAGIDTLVLGAFGCGIFANPPEIVARAFNDVLEEYRYIFDTVEFAVFYNPRDTKNYEAFSEYFAGER